MSAAPLTTRTGPLPLAHAAFGRRVLPFLEARVLDAVSVHTVDLLAASDPALDADTLLGLAFAVRAPANGHVGVDLATIERTLIVEESAGRPDLRERIEELAWPTDPVAWRDAVLASPMVVAEGDGEAAAAAFVSDGRLLMSHRYWNYQRRLYAALQARSTDDNATIGGPHEGPRDLDPEKLRRDLRVFFPNAAPDDRQQLAAISACLRNLTIISGGPGTGKTHTVKNLLAVLWRQWQEQLSRPPRTALAAPTGKAVVRMRDAIGGATAGQLDDEDTQRWLASLVPTTIHRLLGYQPAAPTRFRHDASRPLSIDLLVVDEASMVDLPTMCKLIEAVPRHARIILLGDREQLASVGAGSVLADITSGIGEQGIRYSSAQRERIATVTEVNIPTALCDESAPPIADAIVHFVQPYRSRADSGVQQAAYAISAGRIDAATAWLSGEAAGDQGPYEDLRSHDHAGNQLADAALEVILDGYAGPGSYLDRLAQGPKGGERSDEFLRDVLTRLDRIRVLTAHREGNFGVAGLNATIEAALRERAPEPRRPRGDEPQWHGRPVLLGENRYDLGLMNGDVGVLVHEPDGVRAVFPGREDGSVIRHPLAQLPRCETVFAMTVHKSQGSEFDHSVLVLPNSQSPILTRELIYTALTRARQQVTLCGSSTILRHGLARTVTRASSLGTLLWGEIVDDPAAPSS